MSLKVEKIICTETNPYRDVHVLKPGTLLYKMCFDLSKIGLQDVNLNSPLVIAGRKWMTKHFPDNYFIVGEYNRLVMMRCAEGVVIYWDDDTVYFAPYKEIWNAMLRESESNL